MGLELGLKLTRKADEFTSDLQIATERGGPVFLSHETDAMFVLTAHLKGYKRGNIKIDINEDGTLIAISGQKQVKETMMVGWKVYQKDAEIKGFKKVFRIPDGVILDKIKAKFDDVSTLTITMPKKAKGIRGTIIEEVKENQELVREGSGNLQSVDEKVQRRETSDREKMDEMPSETHAMPRKGKQVEEPVSGHSYQKENVQKVHELKEREKGKEDQGGEISKQHVNGREVIQGTTSSPDLESPPRRELHPATTQIPEEEKQGQEMKQEIKEISEHQQDAEHDRQESTYQDLNETNDIQEDNKRDEEISEAGPGMRQEGRHRPREKRCKMCIPIIAGSTILLSFVVFVFQIIRSKNQTARRRD